MSKSVGSIFDESDWDSVSFSKDPIMFESSSGYVHNRFIMSQFFFWVKSTLYNIRTIFRITEFSGVLFLLPCHMALNWVFIHRWIEIVGIHILWVIFLLALLKLDVDYKKTMVSSVQRTFVENDTMGLHSYTGVEEHGFCSG
ncbi:hypothetical protein GC096_30355 [Paenibacillus sp. LMG 31461]|uniref:Uncharacterized protein n=1 Tax=Paenibacillus plantarum TaxID=2654975 RepID=A0ABX1XJ73_9BACL|nr:hypothetical protein [Paenibacillus plantarum]NOU68334.1 hypothetical protein [Paenibacillus plantarum]